MVMILKLYQLEILNKTMIIFNLNKEMEINKNKLRLKL